MFFMNLTLSFRQEPARPTETPTITDLLWQNLEQFLNDVSTSFKSLVTVVSSSILRIEI